MDPEYRKKLEEGLAAALQKIGHGDVQCPICAEEDWILAEELSMIMLQTTAGVLSIGGPVIPVAMRVCKNCGFVAHHAVKLIAGLPPEPPKPKKHPPENS